MIQSEPISHSLDDYDMTPLNHVSPAAAMLDQISYAQKHIKGNEDKIAKTIR
jgi:hypothetical protein